MITVRTNLEEVIGERINNLKEFIQNPVNVLREVAVSLFPVIHNRIHVEGRDANGSQIGNYTAAYLKRRTKFNRTPDPKVILSLTKQMELDFSAVATANGYGLGFKNKTNYDKSQWVEATYKKKIYGLTEDEEDLAVKIAQTELLNALRK